MNKGKIFDPFRNLLISKTPEEKIRQQLIAKMVNQLGYPINYLAIERKIDQLIKIEKKVKRRADILCFMKDYEDKPVYPLLLIECKSRAFQENDYKQLIGYNYHIKAIFLALVNQDEELFFWQDKNGEYQKIGFLPTWQDLQKTVRKGRDI